MCFQGISLEVLWTSKATELGFAQTVENITSVMIVSGYSISGHARACDVHVA